MKKTNATIAALALLSATSVLAEESKGFAWGNIYGDFVANEAFAEGNDQEALVVGMEGGYVKDALDIYGFSEYDMTNDNTFTKLTSHYTVLSGISIYSQGTQFVTDTGINAKTYLVGIGFTGITGDGYTFKPYFGANYVDLPDTYVATVGWSGMIKLSDKTMVTHWNESKVQDGFTAGGDVGVYYELPMDMYIGAQYRYTYDGKDYDDAIGLRVGVHL